MSTDNSGGDSRRSLIKATSILSVGTLSSRVLGFVRDIVLARFFGTGFNADAFFVALRLPNLFRDLVGEGAANAALVPVFSEYKVKGSQEEFWRFIAAILTVGLMVLSGITILGILFAPLLVRLIAPGFMVDPEKIRLTVALTRTMFPYLILIGMTAYSVAVLFTFRSFTVSAFSPCLLNIAMIVSALVPYKNEEDAVFGLAWGVLAGGVLQLAVQIPPMRKNGFRFRLPETLRHPGAMKVGRLLIPRLVGSGVYQLTVFIDTLCASLSWVVGAGGISAIYYSNRIVFFPMGIFSFAIASAVLPALSDMASEERAEEFKKTLIFSLENIFFVLIPCTVFLMVLATPVTRILFERGEFDAYSTKITAAVLFYYSAGLFASGGVKILVTAFYSLQDTKTPVKIASLCLLINAVGNGVLMFVLGIGGIALASAIAATVNFILLYRALEKRIGPLSAGVRAYAFKVLTAAFFMGVVIFGLWRFLPLGEIVKLFATGCGAVVAYLAAAQALGIEQVLKMIKTLKRAA